MDGRYTLKRRRRKGSGGAGVWAFLMTVIALTLASIFVLNSQLFPLISSLAGAEASNLVTYLINTAIAEQVIESKTAYSDLIHLTYKSDGSVASLESDVAGINRVRSELVSAILERLDDSQVLTVTFPLGNIFGSDFLSGKGPDIQIDVLLSQRIRSALTSNFVETGINQTIHRIYLEAYIDVTVLAPSNHKTFTVDSAFCIAETVMLGDVPDAYTKINRLTDDIYEDEIDYIYDFGATVN